MPLSTHLNNHTTAMQEIHTLILPCPQPFSSSMSGVAVADRNGLHKKPAHRRDDSDELDVFEAARYYAGLADAAGFRSGVAAHRAMKGERRALGEGGWERRSIDVPMGGAPPPSQSHNAEKQTKEKKSKQPVSPGGRLSTFLNSFFHQSSSKKKSKSTPSTTRSCKDEEEESSNGRRRRRSSISHSQSTRSSESSFANSSSSGFRTPTMACPPGKANEEARASRPRTRCNGQRVPDASSPPNEVFHEGRSSYGYLPWERNRRASTNGILRRGGGYVYGKCVLDSDADVENKWVLNKDSKGTVCRDLLRAGDQPLPTERNLRRREEQEEQEDGGDSDSSSDLFDLPNCDLVHFSGGLPVYETTSMNSVKRGSSIASATV